MTDFDLAFSRVIDVEKGYVNDPDDSGGETNFGISKRSYPNVDVRALTIDGAKEIYRRDFWDVLGDIHPAVKFQAFDFAVNSSIQTAIRKLQQAIGAADDGHWGPVSAGKIKGMDLNDVLMRFAAARLMYLTDCKGWPHSGRGWARRMAQDLLYASEDN